MLAGTPNLQRQKHLGRKLRPAAKKSEKMAVLHCVRLTSAEFDWIQQHIAYLSTEEQYLPHAKKNIVLQEPSLRPHKLMLGISLVLGLSIVGVTTGGLVAHAVWLDTMTMGSLVAGAVLCLVVFGVAARCVWPPLVSFSQAVAGVQASKPSSAPVATASGALRAQSLSLSTSSGCRRNPNARTADIFSLRGGANGS